MPPGLVAPDSDSETEEIGHDESKVEQDVDAKEQLNGELLDEVEETSGKKARLEDEMMEDSDDESEEGDTYQVEAIRKHAWQETGTLYLIKWVGYKDKDNTWEPEDNLLPDARDILAAYHHKIGGPPQGPGTKSVKKSKSTHSLRRQSSPDESPAPKRQKRNGTQEIATWLPKKQDWEPEIEKVDTVERDPESGMLMAYLLFKNGKKTKVSMDQVHKHCPRPMLTFYEEHLKFK